MAKSGPCSIIYNESRLRAHAPHDFPQITCTAPHRDTLAGRILSKKYDVGNCCNKSDAASYLCTHADVNAACGLQDNGKP